MTQLPQAFLGKKIHGAVRDFLLDHHVHRLLRRGGAAPAAQVAMLHMGRCGSTVLGEMLGAQGTVFWAGEIFEDMHHRYRGIAGHPRAVTRVLRRSMAEPSSLRSLVRRTAYPAAYGTYGFETKYLREQHLRPDEVGMSQTAYLGLLEAHGFDRFIVLHQHNYLRMIVSRAAGLASGAWHTKRAIDDPPQVDLCVARIEWGAWCGTLLERLRDLDAQHAQLLALLDGRRVLRLSYEKHVSTDPRAAYHAACGFLGLSARPVDARLKKTNPFSLRRSIRNWDEVDAALAGTEYAWMLTQDLPPSGG